MRRTDTPIKEGGLVASFTFFAKVDIRSQSL